jgi:hypothetical protein
LPIDDHVSWEGHLSGAIVGTLLALAYRRQGPKDPTYQFEKEDPNSPLPEWWMAAHPDHPDTVAQRAKEAAEAAAEAAALAEGNNAGMQGSTSTPPPSFSSPTSS